MQPLLIGIENLKKINDGFFKRILEIFNGTEKMVVDSCYNCNFTFNVAYIIWIVKCHSSFRLHIVLNHDSTKD